MRIAIVSFLLFWGLTELHPLMQDSPLPFPVLILAGVVLAIGSNANKRLGLFGRPQPSDIPAKTLKAEPTTLTPTTAQPSPLFSSLSNTPQLPNLHPPQPRSRSISFEIRPPKN